VTLTFLLPGSEPARMQAVMDAVQKAARAAVNAKIVFTFARSDNSTYRDAVVTGAAAGRDVDAFLVAPGSTGSLRSLVSAGAAKDITELFPAWAPDISAQVPADTLAAAKLDGKLYVVPSLEPTSSRRIVAVRDDLLARTGSTSIGSYDELETFLARVHAAEPNIIPLSYFDLSVGMFAEAAGYEPLDYWNGLVYRRDDPAMKVIPWERTPAFRDAISRLKKWGDNGWLVSFNGWYFIPIDASLVTSGRVAAFLGTLGQEETWNAEVANGTSFPWRYKAFTLSPTTVSDRSLPTAGAIAVSAGSKNPERVLLFLDWLHASQDAYDLVMYGVKGKDWTPTNDAVGIPRGTDAATAYMNGEGRNGFADLRRDRPLAGSTKADRAWYVSEITTRTALPLHGDFEPDYSGAPKASLTTRNEAGWRFEARIHSASYELAELDAFIRDQQKAGVDTLVAAVQAGLDAWRKVHGR
jgi:putative aldouronate transport system substrate-binding protein